MIPKYDDVRALTSGQIPEGEHDAQIESFDYGKSRASGNDMFTVTWQVDRGEAVGLTTRDYLVVQNTDDMGWSKLKAICEAAGYAWRDARNMAEFAKQFEVADPKIRVCLVVGSDYNLRQLDSEGQTTGWENNVSKDRWAGAPPEQRSRKAKILRYLPSKGEPSLGAPGVGSIDDEDVPF